METLDKKKIRIGTRGSDLALWQANHLQTELEKCGIDSELNIVKTRGDKDLRPLKEIAGDGFFTKDLENLLLQGEIDLAIHSAKDLASMRHTKLPWQALGPREDTKDVLILKKDFYKQNPELKDARIGTSSPRRRAQLENSYPTSKVQELRGNVPTRLSKVSNSELDGVILAKAGLSRLGLLPDDSSNLIAIELDWVTAACQGILALQGSSEALQYVNNVIDKDLTDIALIEKSILAFLGGGCHMAVGAKIVKNKDWRFSFYLKQNEEHFQLCKSYSTKDELCLNIYTDIHSLLNEAKTTKSKNHELILTQTLSNQKSLMDKNISNDFHYDVLPMIEISSSLSAKEISESIPKIQNSKALIFTSQYAVRIFFMEFFNQSFKPEDLSNVDILCIGNSTRKKVIEFGLNPIELSWEANAVSLFEFITKKYDSISKLYFIGLASARILELLSESKFHTEELFVYENSAPSWVKTIKEIPNSKAISFASPSCVNNFINQFGKDSLINRSVFSMGPSTSKTLDEHSVEHITSSLSGSWDELLNEVRKTEK